VVAAVLAFGQAPPAFEAASVKRIEGAHRGTLRLMPGQVSGPATLRDLILRAYNLKDFQVLGPGWINSSWYEVQAKAPAGTEMGAMQAMLRGLLAERFALEAHRETRTMATYDLMPAKGGTKLRQAKAANGEPPAGPRFVKGSDGMPDLAPNIDLPRTYSVVMGGPDGLVYKLFARRETMAQLADRLSGHLERPVADATGLTGEYDFTLTWSVDGGGGQVPRAGPPPDQIETSNTPVAEIGALPLSGALEKQLGLHLKQQRRPIQVLVIDRAKAVPVEN
jgi:uncharacterized protein (TIGR03435 family)